MLLLIAHRLLIASRVNTKFRHKANVDCVASTRRVSRLPRLTASPMLTGPPCCDTIGSIASARSVVWTCSRSRPPPKLWRLPTVRFHVPPHRAITINAQVNSCRLPEFEFIQPRARTGIMEDNPGWFKREFVLLLQSKCQFKLGALGCCLLAAFIKSLLALHAHKLQKRSSTFSQ